jgi:predicted TIM-barrel fold metal-dependent hydrolase
MKVMEKLKVIDFHIHVGLKEHWKDWVKEYGEAAQSEFYKRYEEMIIPEKFAAHLKKNNIMKAVILPEINPKVTGVVPNEYVFEFCLGFDLFVPFCTINPALSEKPGKDFEKYVRMGANGIKLYPSYSYFYPNDAALYPIYEIAPHTRSHRIIDIQRLQDQICRPHSSRRCGHGFPRSSDPFGSQRERPVVRQGVFPLKDASESLPGDIRIASKEPAEILS